MYLKYYAFSFLGYVRILLISSLFYIAWSIYEVQRTLFSALPGMASSLVAKSSLAFPNPAVTNFELTVSTLWHSRRLAKLDHRLFDNG